MVRDFFFFFSPDYVLCSLTHTFSILDLTTYSAVVYMDVCEAAGDTAMKFTIQEVWQIAVMKCILQSFEYYILTDVVPSLSSYIQYIMSCTYPNGTSIEVTKQSLNDCLPNTDNCQLSKDEMAPWAEGSAANVLGGNGVTCEYTEEEEDMTSGGDTVVATEEDIRNLLMTDCTYYLVNY